MKKISMMTAALLTVAGQALAAPAGEASSSGLMTWMFFAFFALILVAQLVPGLLMLGAALKGLFSPAAKQLR
ncbi:hypothetical protein [Geoalkalibacter sp.]|uniref:hypothetical protein n=1 Tax=Geoalkalibacter sp. TaxID=3041440 RepID=UPI00272DFDE6|nr:hypothetical protein [Geoalkalibacter sp.]